MRMPSAEAGVRNLLLNQRVEMRAPFVTKSVWEKNAGVIDQSLFEGGPIFLGIDLSSRVDLTAIVAVAKDDQDIVPRQGRLLHPGGRGEGSGARRPRPV
jgi:phage terminase large subunit-like protein